MPGEPDREALLGIFLMEAWDTLAVLEDGLGRLSPGTASPAALEPLLVVTHRLRGAAALHGFPRLSELASATEQLLEGLPGASARDRGGAAEFLRDVVSLLKKIFDGIAVTGQESVAEIAAFMRRHPAMFTPGPASSAPHPAGAAPTSAAPGAPPAAGPAREGPSRLVEELDRFFAENSEILAYFRPEAAEHLETMTRCLLALEQQGASDAELATLFRAVHTLKGAAYTVGCMAVGDLGHRIEDLLMAVREDRVAMTPALVEAVFAGVDALRLLLGEGATPPSELGGAVERAVSALARLMPAEPAGMALAAAGADTDGNGAGPPPPQLVDGPAAPRLPAGRRATRERTPAPAGPGIRVNLGRLDALMNLVGELVIARSRLDRHLRELGRVGELMLVSRTRMARAVKEFEGRHSDGKIARLNAPAVESGGAGASLAELFAELEFDRYDDFDILARSVTEISADLSEVQTQLAGLIRTVWDDSAQIQRLTGSLRNEVTRARMVPVGKLFARFARQVREGAKAAGKTVALELAGESVEVDNTVIEQIADPLLHLVQNALTHGIEPEADRRARGKPPHGTVYLTAYHQGGLIYVEVEDDGRGIDVERLKAEAVRQGFLRADAAALLSEREALNLVFLPGFSTAPLVTTAAGRGVGMDVVRTNVSRLNGEIDIETEVGVGTRFTLKLPLTVVISDALLVRAGAETLAIPLNAVKVILTLAQDRIQAVGRTEMIRVDDELVDLLRLTRALELPPAESREQVPVVVLRAGGKTVAVAVDELLGKDEIVIKSLGGFLEGVGPFAGATISGEGRVILLLDPVRLVESGEGPARAAEAGPRALPASGPPVAAAPPAERARRVVLLVDDSISVRKFVGHMLEKAGFRVITANDGAEALQQLTEVPVNAVITDLEMPRVNGYELIEDLRRRPATRGLPVIVLTTRAGEKHLGLARRLGVEHYVTKPVDEQAFVRLLDELTGPSMAPAVSGVAR